MLRPHRFLAIVIAVAAVCFLVREPRPIAPSAPPSTAAAPAPVDIAAPTPPTAVRHDPDPKERTHAVSLVNRLPARFEQVQATAAGGPAFIARGYGQHVLLSCGRAVLAPGSGDAPTVTMRIDGAQDCRASGEGEQPTRTNYFLGNDSSQWRTGVRSYERAKFSGVYPGIDLVYYGTGEHLEYDFVVSTGADPSRIALNFEGIDSMGVDDDGSLVLKNASGQLRQQAPAIYQEVDGQRRRVEGRYVKHGATRVGFELAEYDRSRPVTIDPVLVYSSYFGGYGIDVSADIALDVAGNIYLTGSTSSTTFPTASPLQSTNQGSLDMFVAKMNPSGTQLLYATYIGGSYNDYATSIALDGSGNIILAGTTQSNNFPAVGGSYVFGSATDWGVVALKLSAAGDALTYVAKIGAYNSAEYARVAVAGGEAYVATTVSTPNLPVPNGAQSQCGGATSSSYCSSDAYLFKLNAAGTALVYATYIGGSSDESALGIAVDGAGFAFVVGSTYSNNFPTTSAFQSTSGGAEDGFLTVVGPSGAPFVSSSYLGGSSIDWANEVAIHTDGSVAVVGRTYSDNFPVQNAAQPTRGGEAFVTKFDGTLAHLVFSTYLGGTANFDEAVGVAFDSAGSVYVAGTTSAYNFTQIRAYPILPPSNGADRPFVASYSATGTLRHQMQAGGSSYDTATSMALGADKTIYVFGHTRSTNLPVIQPYQGSNAGAPSGYIPQDTFLMKFAMGLQITGVAPGTARLTGGDTVDISGTNFMSGATVQFDGGPAVPATFVNPTLIRATAPAHAAGSAALTVTNPDGETTTLSNALQYSTCEFSLSQYDVTFGTGGGIGAFDVRNVEGSCSWTTTSSDAWLRITSGATGIGNGHVTFSADAELRRRSATLVVAGRTFTVYQMGVPLKQGGDFTGDGAGDLATFRSADARWTLAGHPDVLFGAIGDIPVPADYDSDQITNRAVFRPSTGAWLIQGKPTTMYGRPGDVPVPGDYDRNGTVDFAVFRPSTGQWFVQNQFTFDWGRPGDLAVPADYDGDRRTDIAVFRPATGEWWIAGSPAVGWGTGGDIPVPADYDGDGRVDIAVYRPSNGTWYVRNQFARSYGVAGDVPMPLDYDGDGRADVAVYRPSAALWFIDGRGAGIPAGSPGDMPAMFRFDAQLRPAPELDRDRLADIVLTQGGLWTLVRSAGGRSGSPFSFGVDSDIKRVADFDGDGRSDLVLFRAGTGLWYVALSSTSYASYTVAGPLGQSGDYPMPADYDGDGRADRAVFRPSLGRWFITQSSDGASVTLDWGLGGDVPMAADFDGDGRADLAVFRGSAGRWYIRRSVDGAMMVIDWGVLGDRVAPADYDGDGRADIAIFRPSTVRWWILYSSTGFTTYTSMDYGMNGDTVAPADYNGDGRADLGVFRPSTAQLFASPTGLLFTGSVGDAVVVR